LININRNLIVPKKQYWHKIYALPEELPSDLAASLSDHFEDPSAACTGEGKGLRLFSDLYFRAPYRSIILRVFSDRALNAIITSAV